MEWLRAVAPLGDRALRLELAEGASPAAVRAALARVPGAIDAVATETHAAITFDGPPPAPDALRALLPDVLPSSADDATAEVVVRVVYDGPDLDDVARAIGASPDEVAALHAAARYRVAFLGFLPGFGYLRGAPPALHLPRRAAPRPRVPAGAVGIAAGFTGVYPSASPGGWHLLGRAIGFEPFQDDHPTLRAGAAVRIERVG